MVNGACHCGSIRFALAEMPVSVTACNCSVCRRLGALWAYCRPDQVTLAHAPADRMAVNARLLDIADLDRIPVRKFDGADSWTEIGGA